MRVNEPIEQELELSEMKLAEGGEGMGLVNNGRRHTAVRIRSNSVNGVGKLPMTTLAAISIIGAGIQFGWALQLSLLTPFVQTLGIPHAWASFIWLCGPISGLLVQPCIGVWSDSCTSKFGRRRPFILTGAILVVVAVLLISFSEDVGYILGDKNRPEGSTKPIACALFIAGFWCLDLSNNTVQGPSRALLSDLSGPGQMGLANSFYSLWIAVGNVLGYSAGATGYWYKWFPWLMGAGCGEACANLKAAFLLAIIFLILCTSITLYNAKETPLKKRSSNSESDRASLLRNTESSSMSPKNATNKSHATVATSDHAQSNAEKGSNLGPSVNGVSTESSAVGLANDGMTDGLGEGPGSIVLNLLIGVRELSPAMKHVLLIMALTWMAWFPFLLFDTDWMGREIFNGSPNEPNQSIGNDPGELYQQGVRAGALGLLLNSVIQGMVSTLVGPLCRACGPKNVWAGGNFILFGCMASTYWITMAANATNTSGENPTWVTGLAIGVFAALGAPMAITMSVPYAMTAELTADTGGGQGLAMGILNLAIVVPQIIVSLGAGPWDLLFGGGNVPAFVTAALFALVAAIIGSVFLPSSEEAADILVLQENLVHAGI